MQQMGKGRGGACAGQSGEGELGNPKRRRLMIEEGGGGSAEQKEDVPTLNGCSNSLNEVVHSSSNPLSTISCQRLPLPSTPQLSSSSSSTSKTAMIPHAVAAAAAPPAIKRRPWKAIFAERLVVERNWRRGKFKTRILEGHTDGIMCMHYDESKSLLATGSYDHTIRLWNLETNQCIRVLEGHTRCVRGVQFDDTKIVSASMDGTIRIWNLKTGDCMRVLEGQNRQGIVCLHFDDRGLLASGSVDSNISVWNILTGKCFTLTGHTDWVNKVQILNRTQLLSCSDDTTVKMWDLQTRQLLKTFSGHTGQIQCFQAWAAGPSVPVQSSSSSSSTTPPCPTIPTSSSTLSSTQPTSTTTTSAITPASPPTPRCTKSNKLITGSLDSTLRIWSLATGECLKTLFGHMEGVWCVQFDSLRIVSGAHDSTVKIWDVESGALMHDLKGLHRGAVNCCQLTDTKIVTGGDDGVVVVWDFSA
ncbi:hypothetical protein HK102_003327 [Quaeritorhiza haematococci]|nr:hypothetical protein HK102_003327 [Quaeritorhiza haematococci]